MNNKLLPIILQTGFFLLLLIPASCIRNSKESGYLDGEYWRRQGLEEIIPFWQAHVRDTVKGAYYLNLSREGMPVPPFDKHPAMIGRQIYGFTCAYLLSGDETYLESAREGVGYLMKYAWDSEYGGWFDLLDENGNPKVTTKTVPNQLYTDVGLAQYFFVTGDKEVLMRIKESVNIRKTFAKDSIRGGYYQALARDLSVSDSSKSKHSHYGYTSSLLLNMILFTREEETERFAGELMQSSIENMTDPDYGWFNGFPAPNNINWSPEPRKINNKDVISAGAQLTATLSLLRMYEITGKELYKDWGTRIGKQLMISAFDNSRGIWFDNIERQPPFAPADTANVYWWLQSYGIFLQLHLYKLTGEEHYLDSFEKMASFWSHHFIDRDYGGAFLSVSPSGKVLTTGKASPWKASYHEMETALLNYLYLNLYVNHKPAVLHFHISNATEGSKHFVSLAEDPSVTISNVTINSKTWKSFDPVERSVTLPGGSDLKMKVTLQSKK